MTWQNLFQKRSRRQKPSLWSFRKQRKTRGRKAREKADKAENQTGVLLAIGLLAAGGAGAYYYLRLQTEKAETDAEDEDLEFYNGPYINEDEDTEDAEETEE